MCFRTCLAVAGEDYCIVAATTRLATGYTILSREAPCLTKISDRCLIISTGFQGDIKTVHKQFQARHVMYQHQHNRSMSCPAMAQLISNNLYFRRFFPYYTSTICAGLDENGKGAVFNYDVIGSMERVSCSCAGTGESLVQPVLDTQLKAGNSLLTTTTGVLNNLTLEECLDLVKDAFVAAGERDIYTGDSVEIHIMTQAGITIDRLELKKD
eukprot:g7200.t1